MADFHGQLSIGAEARDGRTVLAAQAFRAPFHLSKPYWDADTGTLLVQVVNPTAGILSGDKLESDISVGAGAALLVTTPSASRVFQMRGGSAQCRQHFAVEGGGWLEMMPEPLVPHRGCRYRQVTRIEVARGGGLFFADLLMPGRVAHDEAWVWDELCLEVDVRLAGELVLRERFNPSGEELKAMAALMGSGPAACFGNAVLITEETDAGWRDAVHALQGDGLWIGVSRLRAGGWSLKFVAADGVRLRKGLKETRRLLSARFPHLACDARKL
ncbi:MAG TPA: urease accessory protein UreD [Rariglobus sp.]|jgi:urease accessory protein|nr:urease accessory protein UreD [Rariglobus sp.]